MAFLDETGLAELWARVREKDAALESAVFDHAATYIWDKYSMTVDNGTSMGQKRLTGGSYGSMPLTYRYSGSVAIGDDGVTLSLVNPQSLTISSDTASAVGGVLVGKYIQIDSQHVLDIVRNEIYYVPPNASIAKSGEVGILATNLSKPSAKKTSVGTVVAATSTAYPHDGMKDGFYYWYKTVSKHVPNFVIGNYAGTGSTSKTLSFDFTPMMVVVLNASYNGQDFVMLQGATESANNYNQYYRLWVSWSGNSVSFGNGNGAGYAANESGKTHYYFAIG